MRFNIRDWNGVEISVDRRTAYMQEAVKYLVDNPDAPYYYIMTGDMLIFATVDEFENGERYIEVHDTKVLRIAEPDTSVNTFEV